MTSPEIEIMHYFRRYGISAGQMLFFDTGPARNDPDRFSSAMGALIQRGLVVQERPMGAYSLTDQGYRASLRV